MIDGLSDTALLRIGITIIAVVVLFVVIFLTSRNRNVFGRAINAQSTVSDADNAGVGDDRNLDLLETAHAGPGQHPITGLKKLDRKFAIQSQNGGADEHGLQRRLNRL